MDEERYDIEAKCNHNTREVGGRTGWFHLETPSGLSGEVSWTRLSWDMGQTPRFSQGWCLLCKALLRARFIPAQGNQVHREAPYGSESFSWYSCHLSRLGPALSLGGQNTGGGGPAGEVQTPPGLGAGRASCFPQGLFVQSSPAVTSHSSSSPAPTD